MSRKSNNIRVMCRFRPINELEQEKEGSIICKILKGDGTMIEHPDKLHHPEPITFYFDKIFDAKAAQVEVFEQAALPLIDNIFEGYNATIFAYGQTGAGKTHTMMGNLSKAEMHPHVGIIPRVVREIWSRIVHASTNCEFELKVSFLEVYNEEIYDLLSEDNDGRRRRKKKKKREKLLIREYSDEVYVENLNEIYVRDQNELFDLIKTANKKRISAETKMNRTSSRSHAVLTIILGQEDIRTGNSKKSKFCLVDLAGSEKVGKTQAKGIRLKEATSINKSLTTLGTCMNKLAENNMSSQSLRHIPFRESVLTRLLSDSLGGNCKTTLIINCSPCSYNVEETISTLRFGERAKKIKTKARVNQIKTPQQYRKELQAAQTEILKLYRIIEDCAYDIQQAFKGTLNVETCRSYKKLLDLKKYTLQIINGSNNNTSNNSSSSNGDGGNDSGGSKHNINTSLLANILPDLTNLQALKKINTVKKQQKKSGVFSNVQMHAMEHQESENNQESLPLHRVQPVMDRQTSSDSTFDPSSKLRQARIGSFEELDVNANISLVRNKKVDPLKRKSCKQEFGKVSGNKVANKAFEPPDFDYASLFGNIPVIPNETQYLEQFRSGSMEESEFSDYNSEYDGASSVGVMSPGHEHDAGLLSDASIGSVSATMFGYNSDANVPQNAGSLGAGNDFSDFQEEELPKNFLDMSHEQRLQWAKQKNLNPKLVQYRYDIAKHIDWTQWNSDDEEEANEAQQADVDAGQESSNRRKYKVEGKEIEEMSRREIVLDCEYNRGRILMLCRLLRSKCQEFDSRLEHQQNKYTQLLSQYKAKNEETTRLEHENRSLEKEYECICDDKRELKKMKRELLLQLEDVRKKAKKLEKELKQRQAELNIERQNQMKLSVNVNDKTSIFRKRVHEKYAAKYKKIESDIINNSVKDINVRFSELAKAFKSQSAKYEDLEGAIENSKQQIERLKELMRQKESEGDELRQEIQDADLRKNELIAQYNTEMKQMRDNMKKSKAKVDMWRKRAFVYKNAVNSLMEQAEEEQDDDDDDDEDEDNHDGDYYGKNTREQRRNREEAKEEEENPPSFKVDLLSLAHTKLPTLRSFSPRSQLGITETEKEKEEQQLLAAPQRREMLTKSPLRTSSKHQHQVSLSQHRSRGSVGTTEELFSLNKSSNSNHNESNSHSHHKEKKSRLRKKRAMSPIRRNDAFYMTPSQKAALTSVKMKIRGGGGSDDDVYRTPVKTAQRETGAGKSVERKSKHTPPPKPHHHRNQSQPLTQSLPRPTGYSSDDTHSPYPTVASYENKSRRAVPVVGLDSLLRTKSIAVHTDMEESSHFDQSPLPFAMHSGVAKKATSPLPPPPRGIQKQRFSTDADAEEDDDSHDDDDQLQDGDANGEHTHDLNINYEQNAQSFLSPKSHISPAGSFFSKIKHTANSDIDDDETANDGNYNQQRTLTPISRRKQAISFPEPTEFSSDEEEEDDINYNDDEDELDFATQDSDDNNSYSFAPSYTRLASKSNPALQRQQQQQPRRQHVVASKHAPYASGKIGQRMRVKSIADTSMD